MKKSILILAIALLSTIAYSQDTIFTHRSDSIVCKIAEMGEKNIKYTYEGEDMVNSITKNLVSKVKFASGREQILSDKVVVKNESDWEKVIITNVEAEIEGLTRVEEIMAKANSGWNLANQGKLEKEAMDKIKKVAASKGCHVVLILTTTGSSGGYGTGAKASISGIAYKY